jgi:TP901 family phage tail tape measure protein
MATNLLNIKIALDGKSAKAEASGLGTSIAALSFGFNQVKSAVDTVISTAGKLMTPFMDAQEQMANVASLGVKNIGELDRAIQDMGKHVSVPLADLRDGLYQVVSAGVESSDQIAVLKASAMSAKAGLATTTDALNLGSAVVKGYGKDWSDFKTVMDQAFETVKLGQTTFPELAASVGIVTPLAASLKIETQELFGAFAALTGVTGSTSEVATQLRAIMSSLAKPTAELTALVKSHGYASVEAAVRDKGLAGIMDMLSKATGGSAEAMGKYFGQVEAVNAVLALSGPQYDALLEKTKSMHTSAGAMTEAYEIQNDTVKAQIQILKNEWGVILENIGKVILPAVVSAIKSLKENFESLQLRFSYFSKDNGPQIELVFSRVGTAISQVVNIVALSIEGWIRLLGVLEPVFEVLDNIFKLIIDAPLANAATDKTKALTNLKNALTSLNSSEVDAAIKSIAESEKVTSVKFFYALGDALGITGDQYKLLTDRANEYFNTAKKESSNPSRSINPVVFPSSFSPLSSASETTFGGTPPSAGARFVPVTATDLGAGSVDLGLDMALDESLTDLQRLNDAKLISDQEYADASLTIAREHLAQTREIYGEQSAEYIEALGLVTNLEQSAKDQRIEAWQAVAFTAADAMQSIFGNTKASAYVSAGVNIAQGVTKALASAAPPLNFINASLVTAAGAVELAKISKADFKKRAMGGPVNIGEIYQINDDALGNLEAFMPNIPGYILNGRDTERFMMGPPSTPSFNIDYDRLADKIGNRVAEANKNLPAPILDYMRFYRDTLDRYQKSETERTVDII